MRRITALIIISLVSLNSCMLGPKYSRPSSMKPADKWMTESKYISTADTITNLKWFNIFKDSVLNGLINQAIKGNYDLKNAALRIEQSTAFYKNSTADLLPGFSYLARAQNNNPMANEFSAMGIASWEIDFWGKLRRSRKSSYAQLLASDEGLKTILTTLISDVAGYYFLMRDLDNRLIIAQRMVESRTEYFKLIDARFKGGDVSEIDQLQADQQLSIAIATENSIKRQLNVTERSINILLGQIPQAIPRGNDNVAVTDIPIIPAGLPSSLIENRPDIKQAEYLFQSEVHRIGIAQADRFPTFSITGILGLASPDLTNFLSPGAMVSRATANLFGPIFQFGKNKRRVDVQKKEAEIAANKYMGAYVFALGEVESSLVSIETYNGEYEARKHQAEVATKSLFLSKERYRNGYANYLEVLISESYALDAELSASSIKGQQLTAYIKLYRALGGGW